MPNIDYEKFEALDKKYREAILSNSTLTIYGDKLKNQFDSFLTKEQQKDVFKSLNTNITQWVRNANNLEFSVKELNMIEDLVEDAWGTDSIRKIYLFRFLENSKISDFKEKQDLMDLALDIMSKYKFNIWEASLNKTETKDLMDRLFISVDLYGKYFNFLRQFYSKLKRNNPELDSDEMKLFNKVSEDSSTIKSNRKVTLYNTLSYVSKDISSYPIEDISKYSSKINWYMAKDKDPSLQDYIFENLNKDHNKNIDYASLFNHFEAPNFSADVVAINSKDYHKLEDIDKKYPKLFKNIFIDRLQDITGVITGDEFKRDYILIKKNKDLFIRKFKFIKEEDLEKILKVVFNYANRTKNHWSWDCHRIFYKDNHKRKQILIKDEKSWKEVLDNYDLYVNGDHGDFEEN